MKNRGLNTGALDGSCTVVVGCQWGDEGKGKIVDVLASDVDIIARYQGGANAGHTVHVGDQHVVLHQVPSGVLHPDKRCLLGNGVVVDLAQFFGEIDGLVARGVDPSGRIGLSTRAHVVFRYHMALDLAAEEAAERKIGTTGRGIGPAYEAKTGRRGVRVADLLEARRGEEADRGRHRVGARAAIPAGRGSRPGRHGRGGHDGRGPGPRGRDGCGG